MADRIGVMHQGRLLEVGTPDDLYASPATRFVATFLGAANLLLGYRSRQPAATSSGPAPRRLHAARDRRRDPARGDRYSRPAPRRPASRWSAPASCRSSSSPAPRSACACACRWKARCPRRPTARARTAAAGCSTRSRTFPEQRANPLRGRPASRRSSARRIHSLPTPISSFTVVAREDGRSRCAQGHAAARRRSPRACRPASTTRIDAHGERAARHAGARRRRRRQRDGALDTCTHGASQILVLPDRRASADPHRGAARRRSRASARSRVAGKPAAPFPRAVGPARRCTRPRRPSASAPSRLQDPARRALAAPRRSMASTCAPSCASAIPTRRSHANSPSTPIRCWCSASTRSTQTSLRASSALLEGTQQRAVLIVRAPAAER